MIIYNNNNDQKSKPGVMAKSKMANMLADEVYKDNVFGYRRRIISHTNAKCCQVNLS